MLLYFMNKIKSYSKLLTRLDKNGSEINKQRNGEVWTGIFVCLFDNDGEKCKT